jgi:hypothetical protein
MEYQFYTFPILFQHSCSTHTEYIPVSNTEIRVLTTFPWSFTIIQLGSIVRFLNKKIFTDKHSAQYKTYGLYETKFSQLLYSLLLAASIFSVVCGTIVKTEAATSSERSVTNYQPAQLHNSEGCNLRQECCYNPVSHIYLIKWLELLILCGYGGKMAMIIRSFIVMQHFLLVHVCVLFLLYLLNIYSLPYGYK